MSIPRAASVRRPRRPDDVATRLGLADVTLARATGAPRIDGNAVRVLRDAAENFPAWLDAIRAAEHTVFVEQYIFADDAVGREFTSALVQKARAGVRVRVLYDWLGTPRSGRLWEALRKAGARVACFNPFRFDAPLEWLSRDHRKQIIVDGRVAFVSGLCISARWQGDPSRRLDPWRDTGVEITGPALDALQDAFVQAWRAATGETIPADEIVPLDQLAETGDAGLRVVAGVPNAAGVFRLDQVIASAAREYLWLTDAYFVGVSAYIQALCAAAQDGVDVRLLVPGASDIPALQPLSRAGYRPLLAGGVRVFEWNGSMLHAKSAVADGLWARVGSTNLNFASWTHNWELDVAIEDPKLAEQLADLYEEDLANATEIVLTRGNRVGMAGEGARRGPGRPRRSRAGSAARAAAGAMSVGSALGAALTNRRLLGPAEAGLLVHLAIAAMAVAVVALIWPLVLAVPIALAAGWLGLATLWKAWKLRRMATAAPDEITGVVTPIRGVGREVPPPSRPGSGEPGA
ncbi:MAG: phospholipase D-like domain-containing protein [Casimicrobiaceae bacterium]